MKITRIIAVGVLVASLLAVSGRAEASPKLHFLKSKKFWYAATVVVVPGTLAGVLATRQGGNIPIPIRTGTVQSQPKPLQPSH
ncbi:MAG: hypothetical protein LAN36_14180 [Acidobacteriia bacterium]|nr:hypothetical protein [Terriglobia bacterium]